MFKFVAILFAGLAAVVLLAAAAFLAFGRERSLEAVFGPIDRAPVDFETVSSAGRDNAYLLCPADLCGSRADAEPPVFEMTAAELRDRWLAMVARQPRVERLSADEAALQYDFLQRSRLMRYPDTVTVRFLDLPGGRSTLAVFSRSHYGRKDFGVNRRRVEAWLAAL